MSWPGLATVDAAANGSRLKAQAAERQGSFRRFLCDQRMLAFEP
jgi:hypothetical protein